MDEAYAREAEERWGSTDAYRVAATRTKSYTGDEWAEARAEANKIAREFAEALQSGADGADVAERHRQHIDKWYYPCSPAMHARLAEMYVADPRFSAYWDGYGEGLAEFVRGAIRANADDI